jgi:hypothetical protein
MIFWVIFWVTLGPLSSVGNSLCSGVMMMGLEEEAVERRRGRRTRRRGNYYSSKLMSSEDRAELRRAAKVEGLADEIALVRMRLKKAMVEEGEDLEMLSLGLERLSRAIGIQHKMSPKRDDAWLDNLEAVLRRFEDPSLPPGSSMWAPPLPREE